MDIVYIGLWAFKLLGLLFTMIVFHELGHYFYFLSVLDKKIRFRFVRKGIGIKIFVGESKDYVGISDKHLVGLYLSGVLAGFIPYFVVLAASNGVMIYFMMILPYMWGCMKDIVSSLEMLGSLEDVSEENDLEGDFDD